MKYPDPSDYFSAVQERNSFKIDKLKRAEFVAHPPLNLPMPVSGSSAVVFKAIVEGEEQALRFFTREQALIRERYLALGDYFSSTSVSDCMAMSRWVDNAIVINGQSWPMVQMQWVNGPTLDQYVASLVEKKNLITIAQLAAAWRNLIRRMQAAQFAHGDLQHGNVLVDEKGDLRLVDFDCVWIEPFSGKSPPSESGHRNYQRVGRPWGQWMDTFPGLVIYVSLLALSKNPDLWETFHDGENLLFQQEDFTPPFHTDRWRRLAIIDDGELNLLVEKLKACCAPGWTADGTLEKLLLSWSPPAVPPPSTVPSPPTVPPLRMGYPESAFLPSQPEGARWWDQVEPNREPHRRRRLVVFELAATGVLVFGLAAIGVLVAFSTWLYLNPPEHDGSCFVASAPVLTLQPNRGDINTKITASGVGFVRNGKVRLIFSTAYMGEA
ncbi:MAG: phosphotransferase, partial [Pseudonocardiaceae bacterium]